MFIKRENIAEQGAEVPVGLYRARVLSTSVKKMTKRPECDMTTLKCEIISPETVQNAGKTVTSAGRQFYLRLMHVPGESWGNGAAQTFLDKLQIPCDEGYDTDKGDELLKGMEFDIVLESEEQIKRYPREEGEKEGKPILDSAGNPVKNGWQIKAELSNVPAYCNPVKTDMPI